MNLKLPFSVSDKNTNQNLGYSESKISLAPALRGVPTLATSEGFTGDMAIDSGFLYICISKNSWKKIALSAI